jgi:hypothetical protein
LTLDHDLEKLHIVDYSLGRFFPPIHHSIELFDYDFELLYLHIAHSIPHFDASIKGAES